MAVAAPTPPLQLDLGALAGHGNGDLRPDGRGRLTLDEMLTSVWEGLRTDHAADCPVCGGELLPDRDRRSAPAGHCRRCHSALA